MVRSQHAQQHGLATSLLERLIAHYDRLAPAYAERGLAAPNSAPTAADSLLALRAVASYGYKDPFA